MESLAKLLAADTRRSMQTLNGTSELKYPVRHGSASGNVSLLQSLFFRRWHADDSPFPTIRFLIQPFSLSTIPPLLSMSISPA